MTDLLTLLRTPDDAPAENKDLLIAAETRNGHGRSGARTRNDAVLMVIEGGGHEFDPGRFRRRDREGDNAALQQMIELDSSNH